MRTILEMYVDSKDKIDCPKLRSAIRSFDKAIELNKPFLAATYLPEIKKYGSSELASLVAEALSKYEVIK